MMISCNNYGRSDVAMMPIAALLAAASSSLSPACSQHLNGTSGTSFQGKQLGNLTFDLPPAIINVTCCSIVESYARQRSRNATAPIGFTTQVLKGALYDPSYFLQAFLPSYFLLLTGAQGGLI